MLSCLIKINDREILHLQARNTEAVIRKGEQYIGHVYAYEVTRTEARGDTHVKRGHIKSTCTHDRNKSAVCLVTSILTTLQKRHDW